jgi:hypothetical protein
VTVTSAALEMKDSSSPTKKEILIWIALVIFAVGAWVIINSSLPIEIRAKRYAYGLFSRIDILGYASVVFGVVMLFSKRFLQCGIGLLLAGLVFWWSYYYAFELAKRSSPETFSLFAHQEIGCFPDQWLFMLDKYDLEMWDKAILCSEKSNNK